MLIFHEGLPGSGKSFEAMVSHIVPALKKGRHVYAYIEGLDHAKIAEVAEISEERCRELLHQLDREDVLKIYDHVGNDSLVVIDELQNFFPAGRRPLDKEMTQFVTEHRHRGLDVLCMGQVLNDCHKLWQGRIDTKIVFRKLDAIGKATHYKWTAMKRLENGKFQETQSGKRPYDPRYFGTYASHTEDTENTETYADSRTNIKNSKAWKLIKIYGVIAVFALGFIVWFFQTGGGHMGEKAEAQAKKGQPVSASAPPSSSVPPVAVSVSSKPVEPVQPVQVTVMSVVGQVNGASSDYIDKLCDKYRIRLGGVIRSERHITGVIEWRDDSGRIFERLTPDQLRGLGWFVMLSSEGGIATISKPGKSYIATQWPTQDDKSAVPERVPDATNKQIANESAPVPQSAPVKVASSP